MMRGGGVPLAIILVAAVVPAAIAAEAPAELSPPSTVDSGDTAWVLMSAALVLLMTPGLAFFYGGLVRRKNVLSILMQCMIVICLITLQWVLFGYSLSFASDLGGGILGSLEHIGLKGVGAAPRNVGDTIPHQAFMIFQAMFAVITPALIIGAFAERMRFGPFCIFSILWATLVYDPVCHWVWGPNGFLADMGALDFAGGTVVHINAGLAALAAALFIGKRQGYPHGISPPHSLPFAVLGAGLLWFGWFGFNAGSALAANGSAANAFVTTHTATSSAALMWCVLDWVKYGRPTALGMITGAVAGLVAITPAAGFVTAMGSIGVGTGSGIVCWLSVSFAKTKLGYDDSLDAFGVHGVGGMWGALATGIWACERVGGTNGLLYGNPIQLWIQFKAVLITVVYAFVVTYILLLFVNMLSKLRVAEHDERVGLDLTQHSEAGYTVVD